jgi:hypothetical protein
MVAVLRALGVATVLTLASIGLGFLIGMIDLWARRGRP